MKLKIKCPYCRKEFYEEFGEEPDTKTICFYCDMEIKILRNVVDEE